MNVRDPSTYARLELLSKSQLCLAVRTLRLEKTQLEKDVETWRIRAARAGDEIASTLRIGG